MVHVPPLSVLWHPAVSYPLCFALTCGFLWYGMLLDPPLLPCRHPVRGTTVVRAGAAAGGGAGGGGAGRPPGEDHPSPPSLEARLAARRPQLAVEGLMVGPLGLMLVGGGAGAGGGAVGAAEVADLVVRRAAPGQPSRPVLVRRARSTLLDRDRAGEGAAGGAAGAGAGGGVGPGLGGGGLSGDLSLGLAGVQLNTGGERAEAGPGPGSQAAALAATSRQQILSTLPPRHPLQQQRPTQVPAGGGGRLGPPHPAPRPPRISA
ncbi:hypothetical protein Agub_g3191, partial [Astrephomene gubernaculifera]